MGVTPVLPRTATDRSTASNENFKQGQDTEAFLPIIAPQMKYGFSSVSLETKYNQSNGY